MTAIVASVIRRHLKRTENFSLQVQGAARDAVEDLCSDESLVGVYRDRNKPGAPFVIFTTHRILVHSDDRHDEISFDAIVRFELPKSKSSAEGILVSTAHGDIVVPISGTTGAEQQYNDAYLLVMMLRSLSSLRRVEEPTR